MRRRQQETADLLGGAPEAAPESPFVEESSGSEQVA
jgi:hypothetical protein